MGRAALSRGELVKAEALGRVKAGSLSLHGASELLGLSYRQCKRLWKRYRADGAGGLQHGNCGRKSNRGHSAEFRKQVLERVEERYSDFGPTLASEHLGADDKLKVSAETLRRWLREAGRPVQRKRSAYRKRREPRSHFGELVQMDGSFHKWLEERGGEGCMMHMVDDATSKALFRFEVEETTWAAANLLRCWIEQYGVPRALYVDWKNVYVRAATAKEDLDGKAPVTQFGRMCEKLGIKIIAANSPQAKGRVERAHGTHQDRLVKKLRLAKIKDYAEANRYVAEHYLAEHNQSFARKPASQSDFHLKRPGKRELDEIFHLEQERVVGSDWVISYQGRLLQLERQSKRYAPAKSRVTVREHQQGELSIVYRGRKLGHTEIQQRPASSMSDASMSFPRHRESILPIGEKSAGGLGVLPPAPHRCDEFQTDIPQRVALQQSSPPLLRPTPVSTQSRDSPRTGTQPIKQVASPAI